MKNIAYLFLLVFASCKCTKIVETKPPQHKGGALQDKPSDIAKVPLHISEDFKLKGGRTYFSVPMEMAKGRPVKNDRTPPTVNIITPRAGEVSGVTPISVTASDNIRVASLNLTVNGASVASGTTSISTTYNFSTDGTYSITAVARDAAGNQATQTVIVTKKPVIVIPPVVLPSAFELITPPVLNQGGEGSCVSFALCYQRAIEQYYKTGATYYSDFTNLYSQEYLYNQLKASEGCGSGSYILQSLTYIMNNGVCLSSYLPYSSINGCDPNIITQAMRDNAALFKISSYRSILATDIIGIKTALANKHPLTFTCSPDMNMYNSTCGYIWDSRAALLAGHALTVVGYDDSKQALKIINSWGTGFGCEGFVWISYSFFSQIVGYTYQMDL